MSVCGNPNLWQVKPARMCLDLRRPFLARALVEHVFRRRVIVDTHAIAKLSAEQRRGGHVENLAGQIPQRHLDAADRANQIVGRAIRARAAETPGAGAKVV